jgi:hypothetical protein
LHDVLDVCCIFSPSTNMPRYYWRMHVPVAQMQPCSHSLLAFFPCGAHSDRVPDPLRIVLLELTMATTNLIIALVFAGIFGTALVYLLLWYIHRYIHKRCLDLDHWFHTLLPHRSKPTQTVYVETVEKREHRSRSRKRERGRSERAHSRKHGSRDRDDWPRQRDVERAPPAIPMGAPTYPQQPYGQLYYPPLGWHDQAGQMGYPQHQVPMPWQVPGAPQMSPLAMGMPQPPLPHYQPQYQSRDPPQYQQPYAKTMTSDAPKTSRQKSLPVKPKSPAKRARRVQQTDYIHICDEYPPFVLKGLKKAAPPSSSSSSSSNSSDTTLEVPRTFIPRPTPKFADASPFQFSQYPQTGPQAWGAPRSHPQQWMGNGMGGDGPDVNARYAPFMPMSGHTARPWGVNANTRHPAPSNAPMYAPWLLLYDCEILGAYANVSLC